MLAVQDYYSPDNSCMNCVLEQRRGLPITLSLMYIEVAKQVGLSMRGVQLPGHFMIAPEDQDLEILVDPFNGMLARAEWLFCLLYTACMRGSPQCVGCYLNGDIAKCI